MYLTTVSEMPHGPSQREHSLNPTWRKDPTFNGDPQARAGWNPFPSCTLQASWSIPLYQLLYVLTISTSHYKHARVLMCL